MPAFNEERALEASIGRVLEQPFVRELIVVDDGSSDRTYRIASSISDSRVQVFRHRRNLGKGAALRTGIPHATSEYVGIQDADLEYDPADLTKLLAPLEAGLADVVYGSRFLTSSPHRVLLFWHSLGNKFLTSASNAVANINLTDMETCYKVFRRELIQKVTIEESRFGFEPEISIKMARGEARIYEVGISYSGRTYDQGKKINWKDGFSALRCIAKYGWRERRRSPILLPEE